MSLKIACIHCGFVFEDEDMEVCPICGTELGQEWDPSLLKSFVVTELLPEQAAVVAKLLHKKAEEILSQLASDGCVGLDDLTPAQVEAYAKALNNAGIKFAVETPEQKAARVQEQLKARAASAAARAADLSASAEASARARAEAEAKAKEAEAVKAGRLAEAKQAEAKEAAARAAADAAAKQAQAATEAEKARLAAEESKAANAAKAQADAARQLELEKAKAASEAQIKIAEAQAAAAIAAEKTKQMELEAVEAKKKHRRKVLKWGCISVLGMFFALVALFVIAGISSDMTEREKARISADAVRERLTKERRLVEEKRTATEQALFERSQVSAWQLPGNVSLEMVGCPAGSFTMGSPSWESGHEDDETRHRVTLTKPFLIGKYEVTQAQYDAVMGTNPSKFKGANRPVENVTWDDAMAFCEKLNKLTEGKRPAGYKFSLPTEAQWEYACRAGSTGAYAGDLDSMGWYGGNSGDRTHNVGQKEPNAWGIYDMHGNVWEWCGGYAGDAADSAGSSSGSSHVRHGGSWFSSARDCRSAYRGARAPCNRYFNLGFRVALVSVQ